MDENEQGPQKPRGKYSITLAIFAGCMAVYLFFPVLLFYPIRHFSVTHGIEEEEVFAGEEGILKSITEAPRGTRFTRVTLTPRQRLTKNAVHVFFYPIEKLAEAVPAYQKLLYWESSLVGIR